MLCICKRHDSPADGGEKSPRKLASLALVSINRCGKLKHTVAVVCHPLLAVNVMNFALPDAVAVLTQTPATLRALLGELPASWTNASEGPGTWSPTQVVAHLLHADKTNWIPRARVILEHPARTLPVFDPGGGLHVVAERGLLDLLTEFGRTRADCLGELASWAVSDTQLDLSAVHPQLGTVMLRQLLATWAVHDLSHIAQIARVMASQYRDAVGPWCANLRVLRDTPC